MHVIMKGKAVKPFQVAANHLVFNRVFFFEGFPAGDNHESEVSGVFYPMSFWRLG